VTASEPPILLRYPGETLLADLLRGSAGLVLTLSPFLFLQPHPVISGVLLLCGLPFLLLLVRTAVRRLSTLVLEDEGIRLVGPLPAAIRWTEVTDLRLSWYSMKRIPKPGEAAAQSLDPRHSWMELTLRAGRQRITADSTLAGFPALIARAAQAARNNRLTLTAATRENLLQYDQHIPRQP
jgi:hypothetical protein